MINNIRAIARGLMVVTMILAFAAVAAGCSFGDDADDAPSLLIDVNDVDGPSAPRTTAAPDRQDDEALEPGGRETDEPADTPRPNVPVPEKLAQAKLKNQDVVGWIKVPNTNIDYPIVIGQDNKFHLDHDAEGRNSKSGAIFMDYRNADPDQRRHLILYGHNMKNGTMFHDLNSFKLRNFIQNSGDVEIWLYDDHFKFDVYSQFVATTDVDFIRTKFDSDQEFLDYMHQLNALAKFPNDQTFAVGDVVLTLSTCTYEYDDSRCVVQAILKRDEGGQA